MTRHTMNLLVLLFFIGCSQVVRSQSNGPGLPRVLQECYENVTLYSRSQRIPATVGSFIALLDRVERIPGLNMDMRSLSASLLHRFRQDGVERDPSVLGNQGVIPFTPSSFQNSRHRLLLEKLIPGSAFTFPNGSLTGEERCALHFMMSGTVDKWQRGDESSVCSRLQNYRSYRTPREVIDPELREDYEAEVLDEEEGSNGRAARQFLLPPESQCPVEDGVIWTPWGAVSTGTLVAGIAAGLQRQEVSVSQMGLTPFASDGGITTYAAAGPVSNLWAATLAGDLGEVVLRQGPRQSSGQVTVGASGGWNDTAMPRHYFLTNRDNYEMTDAEIRGGLDGLILGLAMQDIQSALGSQLRLSQLLDMYYSERGMPNDRPMRACQRREHVSKVATNDELEKQVRNLVPALQRYLASPIIKEETMETFIKGGVQRLLSYIPSSMSDPACKIQSGQSTPSADQVATPALDLFMVLDPSWNYEDALPTLAALLREVTPHAQGSSLSLYLGSNNDVAMVNDSRNLLDFYGNFTVENFRNFQSSQLDVARALGMLRRQFEQRREDDKRVGRAGGRAQAVLFIVNTASGANDDQSKNYLRREAELFRLNNPDVRLLFLSAGNKDRFRDLVQNPDQDLFLLPPMGFNGAPDVKAVVKRLSELPARIINPACGAWWSSDGSSGSGQQTPMYADPMGVSYLRVQPNYFFHSEAITIRFQGQGQGRLNVCYSRQVSNPQGGSASTGGSGTSGAGGDGRITCRQIGSDATEFRVEKPCDGYNFAIDCLPLYFSVAATESTNRCTDNECRYPDLVRYSINAQGLTCHSAATLSSAVSVLLLGAATLLTLLRLS